MNTEDASRAQAEALVDELARSGVGHAAISPGSRSSPLAAAFEDDRRIATHVVIDERSAGFVAVGVGRAGRVPAAVVCTSGTAAANLYPAIVEASEGRVPLIALTADRPPELRAAGANQTIDQIKMFGDAVRLFSEVGVADGHPSSDRYWRSLAAGAWAASVGSPAGPVHLNVAIREPFVGGAEPRAGGRPGGLPWTRFRSSSRLPSDGDIEALAQLVGKHRRGVIVAGDAHVEAAPVLEFARAAAYPLLAEPTSNLRVGDAAVGAYDALLRVDDFARRHEPEIVVRLGKAGLSKAAFERFHTAAVQVVIDPDGTWLDPGRTAAEVIACEPGALLGSVAKALPGDEDDTWLKSWVDADRAARRAIDAVLDATEEPSEPRTARDLAARLPPGSTLFASASMPVRDLDWFMAPRPGLCVFANRGANGIDGSVSTAVGVALVCGSSTAALLGDLAFVHDQNGLQAARDEKLDIVFVVLNNDGGGIFSFLPQARSPRHFSRLFATPHGLDLGAIASTFGCGYVRARSAEEVASAVGALSNAGVHIVEVQTNREQNVALHERVWRAVRAAVS